MSAPHDPSIHYTISFLPLTHTIEVSARFVLLDEPHADLMMAVWTPGSYMIREYARHVETLAAFDTHGQTLHCAKVRKNRWRVSTQGIAVLEVRYRVYCREMTVRTNWVERDFALLNGAPTFITLAHQLSAPHTVLIQTPAQWQAPISSLPPHPDGVAGHFCAANYDQLVDTPILVGNPAVYEFSVAGKKHLLACEGEAGIWQGQRACDDVEKLVRCNLQMWGQLPYERYVFMNLLIDGRGGLEHRDSTVLMASRWASRVRADYVDWLGLVSHEFFHVWNIKRLRPVELGPFNYEQETPTRSLWIAEGFTAYYDDLMVHRAQLSTQKEYLERLSKSIEQLQTTPGRLYQSLSDASFDAWIKYYRRDENSDNVSVSYYIKGTVVGWLLDAALRAASAGRCSLDDLLRAAYARYAAEHGFTDAEFRALAAAVAGVPLDEFFATAVDGCGELDYRPALAWFGLTFTGGKGETKDDKGDFPKPVWLGVNTRPENGRLVVGEVVRDSPAFAAGINVDDEIVGIDAFRVTPVRWTERLRAFGPGARISLLVARRERLTRIMVELAEEPAKAWKLAVLPTATAAQKAQLAAWLGGPSAP